MKPSHTIKVGLFLGALFLTHLYAGNYSALAQGSKTFKNPVIKGYRLDWCLHWGRQCGKPAADAWCASKMGKAGGYAMKWEAAQDIGALSPTYVIGDGAVCNQKFCDGFRSITCGFSLD